MQLKTGLKFPYPGQTENIYIDTFELLTIIIIINISQGDSLKFGPAWDNFFLYTEGCSRSNLASFSEAKLARCENASLRHFRN